MKLDYGKMLATALSVVFLTCLVMAGSAAALDTTLGVKVMEKEGIGKYLTDGKGMALYTFDMDSENKSACVGDCLANWPSFFVKADYVVEGCEASDFGSFTREGGAEQTTFKGKPLYYFVKDQQAGDTNGQGVNKAWWVVTP